jgi:miniconductance mechanosensitive channel
MEFLTNFLQQYNTSSPVTSILTQSILFVILIFFSLLGRFIIKKVFFKAIAFYSKNHKIDWFEILLSKNVFHRSTHFVPPLFILVFSSVLTVYQDCMQKIGMAYLLVVGIFVTDSLLTSINEIYSTYSISKQKPIKGYIQVLKIFIFIVGSVVFISILLDKNPALFLSGIGALTAVFLLIFKDSLLGLVAGIQLSSNDMLRLGDYIQMEKYKADGSVIDISLNTVKVQNFDKTISTIPSYALISDSFKNWRGVHEAGGRLIKRAIYIDTTSITFCTDEMIEHLKKMQVLSEYIDMKKNDIDKYNQEHQYHSEQLLNGRHMTNIGTFRAYIEYYLKNHPLIHSDMIQVVRQLPSGENGLPIEIHVFTTETDWIKYEAVQSDIFDHIFAIVPQFGLRIFQQPTGHDMQTGFYGKPPI